MPQPKKQQPRKPATPAKPNYDAALVSQLEQYGLTIDDIVAVLEENPENMKYVDEGKYGKGLARAAEDAPTTGTGKCGKGVCDTVQVARKYDVPQIGRANGCDVANKCEASGGYFTVTYHAEQTTDAMIYAPKGTTFTWGSQDDPAMRKHPFAYQYTDPKTKEKKWKNAGYIYGHTVIKYKDPINPQTGEIDLNMTCHSCDHHNNVNRLENLILHGGEANAKYGAKNGKSGPRYGTVMELSIPKDAVFSPELIAMAAERKKDKETELNKIPQDKLPPEPTQAEVNKFLSKNPRLGYLMLKKVNTNVPHNLANNGGANILKYYNSLPKDHPERVALNMLVNKKITNTLDYEQTNKAVNDIAADINKLKNPIAYEKNRPATEAEMAQVRNATPNNVLRLMKRLDIDTKSMKTSADLKNYIETLDKNSKEYKAIEALAKKGLDSNASEETVKHAIAEVVKERREPTADEINNLFSNTPKHVYEIQKAFGTALPNRIRNTAELHEYYNNLPQNSPERKAIQELAIEELAGDASNAKQVIGEIVAKHKPEQTQSNTLGASTTPTQNFVEVQNNEMDNLLKNEYASNLAISLLDKNYTYFSYKDTEGLKQYYASLPDGPIKATLNNLAHTMAENPNCNMEETILDAVKPYRVDMTREELTKELKRQRQNFDSLNKFRFPLQNNNNESALSPTSQSPLVITSPYISKGKSNSGR